MYYYLYLIWYIIVILLGWKTFVVKKTTTTRLLKITILFIYLFGLHAFNQIYVLQKSFNMDKWIIFVMQNKDFRLTFIWMYESMNKWCVCVCVCLLLYLKKKFINNNIFNKPQTSLLKNNAVFI